MHTGKHIYIYNLDIDTQIQIHMNIWTLLTKIYAYVYAAIGYDS